MSRHIFFSSVYCLVYFKNRFSVVWPGRKNSVLNISQAPRGTNFLQSKDGFDSPVLQAKKLTNRVTKVIWIICGIRHDHDWRNADKKSDTLVTITENDATEDKQSNFDCLVFASLVFYLCCDNTRPVIRKDKFNQLVSSVFFLRSYFFPTDAKSVSLHVTFIINWNMQYAFFTVRNKSSL